MVQYYAARGVAHRFWHGLRLGIPLIPADPTGWLSGSPSRQKTEENRAKLEEAGHYDPFLPAKDRPGCLILADIVRLGAGEGQHFYPLAVGALGVPFHPVQLFGG